MLDKPFARYARAGDLHIAYQIVGDGRHDLVVVPGWISNVEASWDFPPLARMLRRLASFSRLITLDKRGTGLSDPIPMHHVPSLEERLEDLRAVLDAVGCTRPTLFGISEGGPLCMLFAAMHPARTRALVVYGSWANAYRKPDYAWGFEPGTMDAQIEALEPAWGTGASIALMMPSLADDDALRAAWGRYERLSASPGRALGLLRMALEGDVRGVLGSISVPTLVMHRTGDRFIDVAHGRYIAEQIPTAEYVELDGEDHFPTAGDTGALLDHVERFVTGSITAASHERILVAILFTDIVGSTRRAVELGDSAWTSLLDAHNEALRDQLRLHRGHEVVSTGDGFLAIFDGPARAVRCAQSMTDAVKPLGLEIRAGVHTGEVTVLDDNIAGLSVHIAARVAAVAGPGEVVVTDDVRKLALGAELALTPHGTHELKGVPGTWELFTLDRSDSAK